MIDEKQYRYKITPTGWIVLSFIFLILIIALIMIYYRFTSGGLDKNMAEWQAIFLSDGQTYFGKIVKENENILIIHNIYYLQDKINLHQSAEIETKDFSLIKLGNEIHGPFDEMRINREHVLYVQDLKLDSKIVQAILKYENSKKY